MSNSHMMRVLAAFLFLSLVSISDATSSRNFTQLTRLVEDIYNSFESQLKNLTDNMDVLRLNLTTLTRTINNTPKICMGVTPPSNWSSFYADTLTIRVDTSSCKFPRTPKYFTSVTGTLYHYIVTGHSSIYDAQPGRFDLYVRGGGASASDMLSWSKQYRWTIQWIGVY